MNLDVRRKKQDLSSFSKRPLRKNFVANEHHSVTFLFTFIVVVDLPTDCILSFLFAAETDVLVPVLSQSTDVVVVNFVVVLKFLDDCLPTSPNYIYGNWQMYLWDFARIELQLLQTLRKRPQWLAYKRIRETSFGSYGWKTLMFLIQRAFNCDFVDFCFGWDFYHPFKEPLWHITWMPIEIHVLS